MAYIKVAIHERDFLKEKAIHERDFLKEKAIHERDFLKEKASGISLEIFSTEPSPTYG
jgi:hypothetical protein